MKKLLGIVVLGLLWCNVGFAGVDGLFAGELKYPNGDSYKMVSEFNTNDEGAVWGKYTWIEKGTKYKGSFFKGKLEGLDLKIFWTDKFGEGWLKIQFDEKFESFDGEWGAIKNNKEKKKEGNWTGERLY